jgi:hypothetical protein
MQKQIGDLRLGSRFLPNYLTGGNAMNVKIIGLAAVFAVSSTLAVAQSSQGKAGSDNGPKGNAPSTMNQGGAAGETKKDSSMPSGKDASTQGAGTAGAVNKKGDAASPGSTMKK